jgi:hypothetical protein
MTFLLPSNCITVKQACYLIAVGFIARFDADDPDWPKPCIPKTLDDPGFVKRQLHITEFAQHKPLRWALASGVVPALVRSPGTSPGLVVCAEIWRNRSTYEIVEDAGRFPPVRPPDPDHPQTEGYGFSGDDNTRFPWFGDYVQRDWAELAGAVPFVVISDLMRWWLARPSTFAGYLAEAARHAPLPGGRFVDERANPRKLQAAFHALLLRGEEQLASRPTHDPQSPPIPLAKLKTFVRTFVTEQLAAKIRPTREAIAAATARNFPGYQQPSKSTWDSVRKDESVIPKHLRQSGRKPGPKSNRPED